MYDSKVTTDLFMKFDDKTDYDLLRTSNLFVQLDHVINAISSTPTKPSHTFPCPLTRHNHSLAQCASFLSMKSNNRLDCARGKLSYGCLREAPGCS